MDIVEKLKRILEDQEELDTFTGMVSSLDSRYLNLIWSIKELINDLENESKGNQ